MGEHEGVVAEDDQPGWHRSHITKGMPVKGLASDVAYAFCQASQFLGHSQEKMV